MISAYELTEGSATYTTADGGVTLEGSGPLTIHSNYFGIEGGTNGAAIDDADGQAPADEKVTFRFENDFFLTGLSLRWTRGEVRISGFLEDPLASVGSYDGPSGTWSVFQPWTSSASVTYTFPNGAASLGQDLELSILDPATSSPQMSPVWISYSAMNGGDAPVAVIIDGSSPEQTIESFGASAYWSFDPTEGWPVELKERTAQLLFSEAGGVGLSSFRFDFGGGDLDSSGNRTTGSQTAEPWTWRFPEAIKTSAAGSFDWTRREGQQWFLRRADDYGISRLTLGSNSPPAWCTKNGRTFCDESVIQVGDTNLDPLKVGDYADYLCDVIEHFRTQEGITFSEISPINESEYPWDSGLQEGCRYYDPADIRNLVLELHGEMTSRGLIADTEILLADHGSIQGANSSNAIQNLHGHLDMAGKLAPYVGYHSYWSDLEPDLSSSLRDDLFDDAAAIGKGTMQTEFCPLRSYGNGRDLSIEPAWHVFKVIHKDLTRAQTSAWSWWRALSPADYKDGLLYTDFSYVGEPNPEVFDSKLLWMMGNFSRFIRPGFTRLGVLAPDDLSGLMFSAWLSPDGSEVVVVAGNAAGTAQSIDLTPVLGEGVKEWVPWLTDAGHSLERGESFAGSYEMPPRSFVSFVGSLGDSKFRLRCVVAADDPFPTVDVPVSLSAKATWEDGLVRIRPHAGGDPLMIDGDDEWVMRPLGREPRGQLSDGRFEICLATTGEFLGLGGDESMLERPLVLSPDSVTWELDTDLDGRSRLRHVATSRVLGDGGVAARDRGLDAMRVDLEEVPVAASVEWADGFGTASTVVDVPIGPRWYQARVKVAGESAVGRLLVRPGEAGSWFDGLPARVSVVKGESVILTPQRRENDGAIRFRLNPADRDESLIAEVGIDPETPLLSRAPNGGDDELWLWVDAATGIARPTLESGEQGWLKNVATGRILRPEGGSMAADTSVVQVPTSQSGADTIWMIEEFELGRWRMVHVSSGHVLSISGTTGLPVLWPDGPQLNLRFHLDPVDRRPSQRWWSGGLGDSRSVTFTPEFSGMVAVHETSAGLLLSDSVEVQVRLRYDDWAEQRFGSASAAEALASSDADSDGLKNLYEFMHGLDPLDGAVQEKPINMVALGGGEMEISFRINPEAAGSWSLETSDDCQNWRVMGVNEYQTSTDFIRVTAGTEPRGFYRLVFTESE